MLSDLPNEILLRVAAFLPIRDLNAVALTASRFFHVFDYCLYRRVTVSSFALWWAAEHGIAQTARKAIEAGATGDCPASQAQNERPTHDPAKMTRRFSLGRWCTPLMLAAANNRDGVVKCLLEIESIDINHQGKYGITPLYEAVRRHSVETIKLLLDSDAIDANVVNDEGRTPLLLAAKRRNIAMARLLLNSGKVEPDLTHESAGRTPLSYVAKKGLEIIIAQLLQTGKVDPDSRDRDRKTPLMWAIEGGRLDSAKVLLETGQVDPDSRDRTGKTPLIWAVEGGWSDIAKLLLETGRVNPDSRDHFGETPLMLAVEQGRADIAKLLLETGGVDPNTRSAGNWTLLNRAITTNEAGVNDGVIRMLVEYEGVDLEAMSAGLTPLIHAARRNNTQLMKQLMDSGRVNPNTVSTAGTTALHAAIGSGREETAKILLSYDNVDLNKRDNEDFTPLGRAAWAGCSVVVELLLRSGKISNINARCGDCGGTPLWWAAVKGRKRAARALCLYGRGETELSSEIDDDGTGLTSCMVKNIRRVMKAPYRHGLVKAGAWFQTIMLEDEFVQWTSEGDGFFEWMTEGDEDLARLFSLQEGGDEEGLEQA